MVVFGYIAAILVGLLLGLLGGGGSILSVPILRYLFDFSAETATGYSLFIVGVSGLVGAFIYFRNNLLHLPALLNFGVVASVVSFLNRKYVVANIPNELFSFGAIVITKDFFIMMLLVVLMLLAARSMMRQTETLNEQKKVSIAAFLVAGFLVGVFTSLVGAGGGFIIVPVLMGVYRIPLKTAIGTSLSIIVLNALAAFAGEASTGSIIEWPFLLTFTAFATVGVFVGIRVAQNTDAKKLKPFFGWFMVALSVYITVKEIIELS